MLWDAWPPMRKTQADELGRRAHDVDIYQAPINTIFFIYLNAKKPPFDNPDMRRAVNLAIDRQDLVAKALEGAGVPCAILDPKLVGDFALPLDEVAKAPGCRQPKEQDIAEAKKLVEKHYPGGLDVEVAVRRSATTSTAAQLVIAQLRKIGIRGTMKTHESAAATPPSARATSRSSPPRTGPWTSTSRAGVFHIVYTTDVGEQLRAVLGSQGRRADRARAQGDEPRQAQAGCTGSCSATCSPAGDHASIAVGWVEGWFFKDKKLRNYKPGLTTYDNNTFMKTWIAP